MAAISSFCPSSTDCLTYRGDHLCCVGFPCVHAVATTPAQQRTVLPCSPTPSYQPSPKGSSGRPVHRPFRGLLSVHSRYGLHTRAATRICGPLYRSLQPLRYLHDCSDYFRLEHFAGWGFHPLESAAFARRTPVAVAQSIGKQPFSRTGLRKGSSNKRVTSGLRRFILPR